VPPRLGLPVKSDGCSDPRPSLRCDLGFNVAPRLGLKMRNSRNPASGSGEQGFSQPLWQFDRRKVSCRVEIIFARFIDDAKLLTLRGPRIRKHLINLPSFERDFVALVSNAHRKFFSSRRHAA
jgi:hypothetical protein